MSWFAWLTLLLVACSLAATLTGRALVGACLLRPVASRSAESFAAAALLGTAAWGLIYGTLSYAGFPARPTVVVIAFVLLLLVGYVWRKRGPLFFLPAGRDGTWGLVAALALGAGLLSMLPVALGDSFVAANDTIIRTVISEHLQDHGFYHPARDIPYQPLSTITTGYQNGGLHLGAAFILAFVHGFLPGWRAIDLYPAVSAWGVALNVLAFFILARWSLGLSRSYAALGAFLLGIAPNPTHWAATHGFLPQTYGTAALMFSLAATSRLLRARRFAVGLTLLLGSAGAFLLSVYNELFPLLVVVVALLAIWSALRRGWTATRGLYGSLAAAVVVGALLANVELYRLTRAIPTQLRAVVGQHVDWAWLDYWSFALGVRAGGYEHKVAASAALAGLTVLASGLLVLGLAWSRARRGPPVPATALGILLALGAYFTFVARDPWTGHPGHTWSLFKLAQWGFPLLLALQVAGFQQLTRGRKQPLAIGGLAVSALLLALPAQVELARERLYWQERQAGSSRPFEAYRELAAILDSHQPDFVYLVARRNETWPRRLIAYFLGPRRIANDWWGTGALDDRARVLAEWQACRSLTLLVGRPPYGRFSELPGGVALVEDDPLIVRVHGSDGRGVSRGNPSFWIRERSAELHVWAARDGLTQLTMTLGAETDTSDWTERPLRVSTSSGHVAEIPLRQDRSLTVQLPLEAGPNEVILAAPRSNESRASGVQRTQAGLQVRELNIRYAQGPERPRACPLTAAASS